MVSNTAPLDKQAAPPNHATLTHQPAGTSSGTQKRVGM
jgi:hypothetical protein